MRSASAILNSLINNLTLVFFPKEMWSCMLVLTEIPQQFVN